MGATRREFLIAGAVAALAASAAACAPTPTGPGTGNVCLPPLGGTRTPLPAPGTAGLVDESWFQTRSAEYLALSTASLDGNNLNSVTAHLLRARQDPTFTWDPSQIPTTIVGGDPFRDTDDFELMECQWALYLGRDILPAEIITTIENKIAGARYRYDDPIAPGQIDNKWFWSENHRGMFACDEYLGGLAIPDRVFAFTGLTGAQHAARTRQVVIDWLEERSKFGFFEWHSNTYLKYSYAPVFTLLEFAQDEEILALAAGVADTAMLDLATNTFKGVFGASHGRGYKGGKLSYRGESSFNTCKFLFDSTDRDYLYTNDIGPLYIIGQSTYRVPEAIRRAGASQETAVVRERHGLQLDPHENFSLNPQAAFGYDYNDVKNLPFWWSTGALTAWQMLPQLLTAAKKWKLFETELFQQLAALKDFLDINPTLAQITVRELAGFAAAGCLGEAHTYSWRSSEAMLASVIDHRSGDAGDQVHAWQATLGPDTTVFTIHPNKEAPSDGYWVGTASMPKTAQKERAAIHIYSPSYASPSDPILGPAFGYLQFTRAWFPQDRFDEVRQANGWTLGRKGDGYVALWSERPTEWRAINAADSASEGMSQPYDLVAPGSPSNVWICEVGGASDHGDFDSFVAAITAATVEVTRVKGINVHYISPIEGDLRLGTRSGFQVNDVATPMRNHPRHSSPWGESCEFSSAYDIQAGDARVQINSLTGARVVS